MVANYQKAGPATVPGEVTHRITSPSSRNKADDYGKWFVSGNVIEGNSWVSENNWLGGVHPQDGREYMESLRLLEPWPAMAIGQQAPEAAFVSVLENAGAVLPKRDSVDLRIVDEVKNGTATFEGPAYEKDYIVVDSSKKSGIIDSQTDVGGWPELESGPAPVDTDHDGMPDEWEVLNDLNPHDADDRNIVAKDGYTLLEKYLNSLN